MAMNACFTWEWLFVNFNAYKLTKEYHYLTVKYLYPATDTMPAIIPINIAPCGPISKLHTEPTATPPKIS